MGLFSSLLNRVMGRGKPAGASPIGTHAAAHAAASPQTFQAVTSSNVAAIRWFPGDTVMGMLDPANKAQPGPQGGAPILGGVKDMTGTLTSAVPVATRADQEVTNATLGTLEVMFKAKGKRPASVYQYFSVPRSVFMAMAATSSKGKFVWQHLRGKYRYRRIR